MKDNGSNRGYVDEGVALRGDREVQKSLWKLLLYFAGCRFSRLLVVISPSSSRADKPKSPKKVKNSKAHGAKTNGERKNQAVVQRTA
ncbi:MAG: hypothetical protein ABSG21_05465 [Spirochaetia bacterium]